MFILSGHKRLFPTLCRTHRTPHSVVLLVAVVVFRHRRIASLLVAGVALVAVAVLHALGDFLDGGLEVVVRNLLPGPEPGVFGGQAPCALFEYGRTGPKGMYLSLLMSPTGILYHCEIANSATLDL